MLQFPPSLSWHVLPHLRLLKNIQPAACLIWCSRPSPPPPLAQSKRKVRGLWETGNSKTPDSGRRVSGERRGCGDQERGEKGDERVRGDSFQGAAPGTTQGKALLQQQTQYSSRYQRGPGDLGDVGKTQRKEEMAQKRGYSGHSQQDYLLGLLAGNKALQSRKG